MIVESTHVTCPYCWEQFETTLDWSAGEQEYVEDCEVCCNPIRMRTYFNDRGEFERIEAGRENE